MVPQPGLRATKRHETSDRIIAAALRLFAERGFEAVTLDEVAAEAGIARRTFFNYFRSKDDILLSLQAGLGDSLAQAVRGGDPGLRPLDAVEAAFRGVLAGVPPEKMLMIDRLMRSNAAVQAAKQASYARHEQQLLAALQDRWPEPERALALRLVAIAAVGALRLAVDRWAAEGGQCPMADLIAEAFAALRAEV